MSDNTKPIRGKVATILNSRELVINIGEKDGVTLDMKFEVLDPKGEDVIDPDTKEILGSVSIPKVRVKVAQVQEYLSVTRTYKKQRINIGGGGPDFGFATALMPPKWIIKYETLKTDEATREDLDEEKSYVKTGDPVIQVFEDEPEE